MSPSTLFAHPFLVVDLETTGLPGKDPDFEPRVVEVGIVVVGADGTIGHPLGFFVRQPDEHLHDPRAAEAFRLTGIDPAEVARDGVPEEEAAERLVRWIGRVRERYAGLSDARAFNDVFDFGFLAGEPWRLFDRTGLVPGECLMRAAMSVMGPAGALPAKTPGRYDHGRENDDPWKWPRLAEAVAWFNGRGHPIAWTGAAHRATEDAAKEALLAVAIERERKGWGPPRATEGSAA